MVFRRKLPGPTHDQLPAGSQGQPVQSLVLQQGLLPLLPLPATAHFLEPPTHAAFRRTCARGFTSSGRSGCNVDIVERKTSAHQKLLTRGTPTFGVHSGILHCCLFTSRPHSPSIPLDFVLISFSFQTLTFTPPMLPFESFTLPLSALFCDLEPSPAWFLRLITSSLTPSQILSRNSSLLVINHLHPPFLAHTRVLLGAPST